MSKVTWLLIGLLVGGALGYLPMYLQNSELTAALEDTQRDLGGQLRQLREREQLAVLATRLGAVLVEAQQKNFTVAREHSTVFFDSVRQIEAATVDEKVKQILAGVLSKRDEITADLAMGNDQAAPILMQLFMTIEQIVK